MFDFFKKRSKEEAIASWYDGEESSSEFDALLSEKDDLITQSVSELEAVGEHLRDWHEEVFATSSLRTSEELWKAIEPELRKIDAEQRNVLKAFVEFFKSINPTVAVPIAGVAILLFFVAPSSQLDVEKDLVALQEAPDRATLQEGQNVLASASAVQESSLSSARSISSIGQSVAQGMPVYFGNTREVNFSSNQSPTVSDALFTPALPEGATDIEWIRTQHRYQILRSRHQQDVPVIWVARR